MFRKLKRMCSVLLILALLLSIAPMSQTVKATEESQQSIVDAVLAQMEIAKPVQNWEKDAEKQEAFSKAKALKKQLTRSKNERSENKTAMEAAIQPGAYAEVDTLFAQIDAMEIREAKRDASQQQLTDAAAEIVMASDSYVKGSLERNGDVFTWWTDEGVRCVYSPRMRQIQGDMSAPENTAQNVIENEPTATKGGTPSGDQVYLVAPYYGHDDTFTDQYKNEAKRIATAIGDTDGYTLYSGTAATVDKVAEAVANGAVVIFDSHGMTDYENGDDYVTGAENSYLCLTSTTGLTSADYDDGALYYSDGICINGATIANHMKKNSPGGILWMALCLGMATDTLCQPMRQKGVEVVYGYSQSVTFAGDYLFEETFWDEMLDGHTVAESIAKMKIEWGNWDWSPQIATHYYSYDGYSTISAARKDYCSFPIVVSDEDAHPGQRGKDGYGACSLQDVKSTYSLGLPAADVPGINSSVSNYRKLVQYIDTYGIDMDGVQTWFEWYETEGGIVEYYLLQNVSGGILFDLMTSYESGVSEILTDTQFLLTEAGDELPVDFWMGYYYYDSLWDYVEAYGYIDRREFDQFSAYQIDGSDYFTSQQASDMFNLNMQMLCSFWDRNIYVELDFGLKGLGFTSYNGYGDLACAHSYDNDCDPSCNSCGETRPVSHTYSGACDSTCDSCNYTRTTSVKHSFGVYSRADDTYHYRTCAVCGSMEWEKHGWDAGTVIQAPTESTAGVRVHYCADCGATKATAVYLQGPGDLDGVNGIDEDDVIYLLQHLLMSDDFPVDQNVDYDKNGIVDEDDVIYLLQHLLMPDDFPLA